MTSSYSKAQTGAVAEQSAPVGTSAVARWHWVQTKILNHPDLSTAEICVAVVLASHVNDRTQACFPKIETIAQETSLSDRKVRQALKRLTELGLVSKLSRAVGRLRNRNAYQLIGLGAKPASGSIKPASDAGVKPAPGAGSYKKNTDKELNTDEKEQANAVPGTGATVLPAVDDQCLILAREWQRLCCEPWTLANACLRVNEAINRSGVRVVSLELTSLQRKGERLTRLAILDFLDGLMPNVEIHCNNHLSNPILDPDAPEIWNQICKVISGRQIAGCQNPVAWLTKVQASVVGETLRLTTNNRCTQDFIQNALLRDITHQANRNGLSVVSVCCQS
jgi:DNA-binding transcriptional ArsR family regulator